MLEKLKKNLINIPGKSLDKKYLVFESDDWGSIRTPDKAAFDALVSKGLIKENDPFSKYDCLESETDLSALFEVLTKFKDNKSRHAVITANTVVGNPDFIKIKESGFNQYYYEPFVDTYVKYGYGKAFNLIQQGITDEVYYPQFHAREHLNVPMWMELLREGNEGFLYAFDLECFSIDHKTEANRRNNVMAAYDYYSNDSFNYIKESIKEGLQVFEQLFSFRSASTIAPCYVWNEKIEDVFKENEVQYIQGSRFQQIPVESSSKFRKKFHYNGEKNGNDQRYLLRNGLFEPSINSNIDWVNKCLESIDVAFKWKKPAIIGTHRINFCGSIFSENRDKNIKLLTQLLQAVLKKWPDVEFVSTVELAEKYKNMGNG